MTKVLVSGGAGYIGSTVCSALKDAGIEVVVVDSLVNGRAEFVSDKIFYKGDIGDSRFIDRVLADHPDISVVMHFAALTIVEESTKLPSLYYRENVCKALSFLEAIRKNGVEHFIYSSSASIYDTRHTRIVREDSDVLAQSPYAYSKYAFERILSDVASSSSLKVVALRYFNPIGADPKMRSGPYAKRPTHILGKILLCYEGIDSYFSIMGTDYPTRDGTAIRDYIHVWDLAEAHVQALLALGRLFDDSLSAEAGCNFMAINLGTGSGVTVKELLDSFERVADTVLPKRFSERRPGDSVGAYADIGKAWASLGWAPRFSVDDAIMHALEWNQIFRRKIRN